MLYLAIPAHNEVATIGVLLWRLRTVLAEFPREYEVVVYDDASTDDTAEVAAQYERAMPVTVLRGRTRLGYAGAVDALLRHVASSTRYPRRDAVLLLQGDFTDPPGIVPEFARRFEGGADLVVGERLTVADAPTAVKRLFKFGHWAMRPFVKVQGVADLTASMRLVRISALREAIRLAGSAPLVSGDSWTANADLLLRLAPHARRVENVPMEPTFGVRMRETRRVAMADTISVFKWAWAARGRRAVVGSSPAETGPDERRGSRGQGRRREEPAELSVERLREKVRDRDGSTGIDGEQQDGRRGRRRRERPEGGERPVGGERPARPARTERTERTERPEPTARAERVDRTERPERQERAPREKTRGPRPEREPRTSDARGSEPFAEPRPSRRREEPVSPFNDPTLELDDPFAAPSSRRDTRPFDDEAVAAPQRAPDRLPPMDQDDDDDRPPTLFAAPATEPIKGSTPMIEYERTLDQSDAAPEGEDTDDTAFTGAAPLIGEDGEPKRKRRRNRRSRRGRRRKSADGVEGELLDGETEQGSDDSDIGDDGSTDGGQTSERDEDTAPARPAARERQRDRDRVRFSPTDHIDGEPVTAKEPASDDGDDADDDGDDELSGGVESMSEGAPRPRRRGRRGRRGGARRSRGRKERGDGEAGPSASEAAPDGD